MRILVFSDIHGNLPAFETLLKHEKADIYISLGDMVNYGPWQNECVDLVHSLDAICLIGNHEQYYIHGNYPGTSLANRFFNFCYPTFNRHEIIKFWHKTHYIPDWIFRHTYEDMIIYPDTKVKFSYNYMIGHSHHQSIHQYFTRTMYCIGSVGQNRKHINCIDYCVITDGIPELKHLPYDESLIINEMKARKYPEEFIEYYDKKQRGSRKINEDDYDPFTKECDCKHDWNLIGEDQTKDYYHPVAYYLCYKCSKCEAFEIRLVQTEEDFILWNRLKIERLKRLGIVKPDETLDH